MTEPTKPSSSTIKTTLAGVAGFLLSWLFLFGFFAAILFGILVAGIAALVTGRIGTPLGDDSSAVRPVPAPRPAPVDHKPAPVLAGEEVAEDEIETAPQPVSDPTARDAAPAKPGDHDAVEAPPPVVVEEAPVPAPVEETPDPVEEGMKAAEAEDEATTLAPNEHATPAPATADTMAAAPDDDLAIGTDASVEPAPGWLDGPRGGAGDDLKKLRGVGPKLEKQLNAMGIYHYDQIAAWSSEEVAWMDSNLKGFRGRVSRDGWVEQAQGMADAQG